ncbi:MAG TPA: aminopeptidase [Thermoleophilia bacterium]|nr:aminopeptidase [Thermoleophilia bacterium]
MPDPRLSALARVLCRYSLEVGRDDLVMLDTPALATPLVVELVAEITRLGGHPMVRPRLERVHAALLEHGSDEQIAAVTALDRIEVEHPDKVVTIWAQENNRYLSAVPSARLAVHSAAFRPLFERTVEREAAGEMRWVGTAYPCRAAAQDAGMSLPDWERFVYAAGHLEDADPIGFWREQSARQARVVEVLSQVSELRIVAEGTDLRLQVEGRTWQNADGRLNFPDGEVYTSPNEMLTEGHIRFDFDAPYNGRDVRGVRLWFEGGRVVREEADHGAEHLTALLDQDPGARLLGEVAFGMNDEIQIGTHDTLFDEKIGGTCHVALGMAFPECGGRNVSGLHWDLVCDLRRGGEVYGDGRLIARDGRFL